MLCRKYFPSFEGDERRSVEVLSFLANMFHARVRDSKRPIFKHFTTAVDTSNMKHVFEYVKQTILERNIQALMLS